MSKVTSIMKYTAVLCTILAVTLSMHIVSDPVITLFIQEYPHLTEHSKQLNTNLSRAGTIAHNTLHGLIQPCIGSGIFATYAGFLNVSDCNGQLQFPRKQEHPLVHLLITDQITPIMINGMTVHHWELQTNTLNTFYTLECKQDPETHLYYWQVETTPLPVDASIPLDTIIIFADAHDLYLPTGITLTDNTPNYVLPAVYIKEHIHVSSLDLYALNVKHFFGALRFLYKKQDSSYSSLIAP